MGAEMMNGAVLAIEEINAGDNGFRLAPIFVDPGGDPERYEAACAELVNRAGVTHIVGCYTSASRKQVLPLLARSNALLWHPARYEGFEACENIVYVGAAPNQHIVPLAQHMIEKVAPDLSRFLICPMPGLLVSLNVAEGDKVEAGQPLAVVEAMKMENILRAEKAGAVKKVNAKAGDSLAVDAIILEME